MKNVEEKSGVNKSEILFITAETGYVKTGLEKGGYRVLHPYNYKTVIGRVLLEILIRTKLPQAILFNREIAKDSCRYIIVQDSIITKQFLEWLKVKCPKANINYQYTNMVGKAHHLLPCEIPADIVVWTYDEHDSNKYEINLNRCGGYYTSFIGKKREKKYDVMFVGKDKGRSEYIFDLKNRIEELGLKTKFLIMPSTRISKQEKYYSKPIAYEEVIKLVTESKAILNVTLPEQRGATMRDYESVYNEVKLITTNKNIKNFPFYNSNNIFIIGEDDYSSLPTFINTPFESLDEGVKKFYSLDAYVEEILCSKDIKGKNDV